VEGGENDVFPSPSKGNQTWNIPRVTNFETFQGPLSLKPSIGHQARCFPIDLQTLYSFQGPSNMEHSKGHQTWNLPRAIKLGTFHWPQSWGLPSPPSFPYSLKTQI